MSSILVITIQKIALGPHIVVAIATLDTAQRLTVPEITVANAWI
ncbi:hypothetical protein [Wolbachia endosymbiont of Brugia malayi]